MMQATKKHKTFEFKRSLQGKLWNFSAFLVLVGLTACASSGTFRWPEQNPFKADLLRAKDSDESIPGQHPLRIAFTSNVMGEVEPCGCAVGPKGGLDRRLNFIDMKLKKEESKWPFLILDAGNSILATTNLDASRIDAYKKVARELLVAHAMMGVRAQNVGYLDLGLGVEFFKEASKKAGLEVLSASWVDSKGELLFAPTKVIQVGGLNVLVTGLSGGFGETSSDKTAAAQIKVKDPVQALVNVLTSHADHKGPIVVMSDLGLMRDEEVAKNIALADRALIFVGARDLGGLALPKQGPHSLHVQSEFRGQQWGLLDIQYLPNSIHWVNINKMNDFSEKWDDLLALRESSRERLKQSRELKIEEARLAMTAKDLLEYAPGAKGTNSFYDYELINLDFRYQGRNRLTSKMNYLIDIKK